MFFRPVRECEEVNLSHPRKKESESTVLCPYSTHGTQRIHTAQHADQQIAHAAAGDTAG